MNKEKIPRQKHCSLLTAPCSLLIALCSLLLSCPAPSSFSKPENIPDGKGSFTLSITVGRTILPTLDQSKFDSYALAFTPTKGSSFIENRASANINDPVYLDEGTYSLVVTAYLDNKAVAQGGTGTTPLVISLDSNTTRDITLIAINDGIGTGTFKYTVNFPADVTTNTMKITPLDTDTPEIDRDLTSGAMGTLDLNAGYYNVVFTFVREVDSQIMKLVWREILHIYGNLDSTFEKTFTSNNFYITHYAVTFNSNGGTAVPSQTVAVDGLASRPYAPANGSHEFDNWYIDSTLNVYDFATPVTGDIALHARWVDIDNNEDFKGVPIHGIFNVAANTEWNAARTAISNGGNNKNYVINVIGNFGAGGVGANSFGDTTGIKVALRGEGKTLSLSSSGNMMRIGASQTVILRDLTLQGRIPNGSGTSLVFLSGTGSAFTMHGGELTGNASSTGGGGVMISSGGTFTMNGGTIFGNRSQMGGGVLVAGGTFIMHGGTISGNEAYGTGTDLMSGGGMMVMSGTVRIITGTIYGNNEDDENLRNTSPNPGAALYVNGGTAQHGTFAPNGTTWNSSGNLSSTDDTIRVVNGTLQN